MVQRTDASQAMNREEMGDYLVRLGEELRGEGDIEVEVANRRVRLHPSEAITLDVEVVERSPLFRSDRETVTLEMNWRPARD